MKKELVATMKTFSNKLSPNVSGVNGTVVDNELVETSFIEDTLCFKKSFKDLYCLFYTDKSACAMMKIISYLNRLYEKKSEKINEELHVSRKIEVRESEID